MSWHHLPVVYQQIAESVCTPAELRVLKHRCDGVSQWRLAIALGVSRSTVRTLEQRAYAKIANHPDFPEEATA